MWFPSSPCHSNNVWFCKYLCFTAIIVLQILCTVKCFCFQFCLYLTVWLAEDCHFLPQSPQSHLLVSHDQTLHISGAKNANKLYCPKSESHWVDGGGGVSPLTKISIFLGPKSAEMFVGPPKVILGSPLIKICIILGPKNANFLFCSNTPKVICVVSPMTKICVFWWPKMQKNKICIFVGPNYLPHAATNTAAYKCISLFCNTFLPSGKAILVQCRFCCSNVYGHNKSNEKIVSHILLSSI